MGRSHDGRLAERRPSAAALGGTLRRRRKKLGEVAVRPGRLCAVLLVASHHLDILRCPPVVFASVLPLVLLFVHQGRS